MTPEHKAAKKQIKRLAEKWGCLAPPGWDVKHVFLEISDEGDGSVMAEAKVQWEYHQATIRWYLPACCGQEDSWIEGTMIHEYVHVLTAPMEQQLPDEQTKLCEYTVESIAQAIRRVEERNG